MKTTTLLIALAAVQGTMGWYVQVWSKQNCNGNNGDFAYVST